MEQSPTPLRSMVGSPSPIRSLSVDGVQLVIHVSDSMDSGSAKPAILCLHAIGHGGRDFEAFEKAASDRYQIITLDWPGQGHSSQDRLPASATRYSDLLSGVVEQLGLKRFVILGNSIGGAAAIRYAAKKPGQVAGLILCNPGGLDQGQGGLLADLFMGWHERKFKSGAKGAAGFAKWFKGYYNRILITPEARAQKEAIIAAAYEIAPRLAEAWHSFRSPEADIRPLIPSVQMPVLFAWAKNDGIVQWKRNRKAVESFKNQRTVQLSAGHAPFLEAPEAFNREALQFLKDIHFKGEA